jgi:hypothetical protein
MNGSGGNLFGNLSETPGPDLVLSVSMTGFYLKVNL